MTSFWMVAAALAMTVADTHETAPTTYLVASLRDGSLVVGQPDRLDRLPFDCVVGRVQVPVNRIALVEMGKDGEAATITTTSGDRLNGHFDIGALNLRTEKGTTRLLLTRVARWYYDGCGNVGNVALASRGATVDGPDSYPENLLDGKTTGYHGTRGWARSLTPATWVVTLPRKYPLQQIRLLLYDRDSRAFRYTIETSADGQTFEMVADRSQQWSRSWQKLSCHGGPVRYIRLQCLDSTYNNRKREDGFFAVELEAYCRPPKPQILGGSIPRLLFDNAAR